VTGTPTDTPTVTPLPDLVLRGLVYDQMVGTGHPLSGAVVTAQMCFPRVFQVHSGAGGRYELAIPHAVASQCTTIDMYLWADGYYSREELFSVSGLWAQPEHDFGLVPLYPATPTPSVTPTATPTRTPTPTTAAGLRGLWLPIIYMGFDLSVPTPSASHTPTHIPGPLTQLIDNPSFEWVDAWVIPTTEYSASYSVSRAHTGQVSMRMGQAPGGELYSYSSVQQTVTIPAGTVHAELSFWYFAVMSRGGDEDRLYLCVLAEDDHILACDYWTDLNQAWTLRTYDLAPYAGQTIKVHFGVRNDGLDGISAMYVDDVELWVR
jgi:hypothetical protein